GRIGGILRGTTKALGTRVTVPAPIQPETPNPVSARGRWTPRPSNPVPPHPGARASEGVVARGATTRKGEPREEEDDRCAGRPGDRRPGDPGYDAGLLDRWNDDQAAIVERDDRTG